MHMCIPHDDMWTAGSTHGHGVPVTGEEVFSKVTSCPHATMLPYIRTRWDKNSPEFSCLFFLTMVGLLVIKVEYSNLRIIST